MKTDTRKLLDKAGRALVAAQVLLNHNDTEFAAGRAYYAMFYTAEALLHEKDLRSRKHSGIHSLFGEAFAKTGVIDVKFHRWLLDAFDKRIQADYGFDAVLTAKDAAEMIAQAREFIEAVRRLLQESN